MRLDEFRRVLRAEVKKAIREELKDLLNEAVKYASTPTLLEPSAPLKELTQAEKAGIKSRYEEKTGIVASLLEETRRSAMDLSNFGYEVKEETSSVMPGELDISNLDFVKRAKQVVDAIDKRK